MKVEQQHKPLRIAILGSRGIPAEFGGFETFAEQLAVRLAALGHDVTVFCERSQSYSKNHYQGVNLVYLPTPPVVGLRSIWFDVASIIMTLRGYSIVYMLGYHAAFAFFLPRLFRTNFWTNMDGLEWKRDKWSPLVKRYLELMEWCAARFSHRIIADAEGIATYLNERYGVSQKTTMIPYGAEIVASPPDFSLVDDLPIESNEYYLVVCRLEPENHVREIVEGFSASNSDRKLIVVGDHSAHSDYVRSLLNLGGARIVFVGAIYDPQRLLSLRWHCRAYFHGHSVGGTNPSLLEAMACANHTVAHDNVFNREVTGNIGDFFAASKDIPSILARLDTSVPSSTKAQLVSRVESIYSWTAVAASYAEIFQQNRHDR
ncbi:DUF1972 domain-containing protein [Congregibacter variabilis]|uniref:DUF1972 domain-containing protein n=1 Tax=Congregibacter variabilis TaxID=3081200 RepID=A0ABZ0I1E3_9GAMM|nr:DUF1972 domain-containing protein [Congregibacter sp. IMCC43200]